MYCHKCGKSIPDTAVFCSACGARQTEQSEPAPTIPAHKAPKGPAPELRQYPHPYHKFGGWLAYYAVAQVITLCLLGSYLVMVGIANFERLPFFGIALYLVHGCFLLFFSIRFLYLALKKNQKILRHFDCYSLIWIIIALLTFLSPHINYIILYVKLILCLFSIVQFAIWIPYFSKSVRVRTYFDSDEYLKLSLFSKKAKAPEPATDVVSYGQSQTTTFNTNSPALVFLSIGSSIACVILLLLKWLSIPVVGYLGGDSTYSIFTIVGWVNHALNMFSGWPDNLETAQALSVILIVICAACMLVFLINIYQVAVKSRKSRVSAAWAMILMLIVFFVLLAATIVINSYLSGNSYGIINSVVSMTAAAYIAPILAVVNFALVMGLTRRRT